jgi:excisionase family DNA binding protein
MASKNYLQVESISSDSLISELSKEVAKLLDARLLKLQPPINDDAFITRQDVAKMFNITLPTVHAWINAGILKTYKIGKKTQFKLSEVKAAAIPTRIKNGGN